MGILPAVWAQPKPTLKDAMPDRDEQFDTLPPAIVDALRDLDGPAVLPDSQRDADVLTGVRQHLADAAAVDRKRRNLRLFFAGGAGGAIAAAAMITVVVFIGSPAQEPQVYAPGLTMQEEINRPELGGDLDADGSIDILDAYLLAKQVTSMKENRAVIQHDMNGDGSVDQRDVDWIANQAVALKSGERG